MRTLISLCVLVCSSSLFAASVEELTWMKGRWAGPYGPGTLEETWNDPRGDTMVAVVRMTAPDGTNMVELVIINEEDNTLVLRLQQFSPTYEHFPAHHRPCICLHKATGPSLSKQPAMAVCRS